MPDCPQAPHGSAVVHSSTSRPSPTPQGLSNAETMTYLDPSLRDLAQAQHGLFTTKQAHRTGLTSVALVHAVRSEELLHPARGLYAVADLVDPTSPSRWHTDLSFGAGLLWDDATLSSTTAVLAHGVQVW